MIMKLQQMLVRLLMNKFVDPLPVKYENIIIIS